MPGFPVFPWLVGAQPAQPSAKTVFYLSVRLLIGAGGLLDQRSLVMMKKEKKMSKNR